MDYYLTGKLTRSEEICNMMMQNILNGIWALDAKIPSEHQLCSLYSTSRSTIRMAITLLQGKGFLITKPGIGSFVTIPPDYQKNPLTGRTDFLSISETEKNFIDFRQTIECKAIELFALRASPEDFDELRSAAELMKKSVNSNDDFTQADLAFHNAIYRGCKNEFIVQAFENNSSFMNSYFCTIDHALTPLQRQDVALRHEAIYLDLKNGMVNSAKERLSNEIVLYFVNMYSLRTNTDPR